MKTFQGIRLTFLVVSFLICAVASAQQPSSQSQNSVGPRAVRLSVIVTDRSNHSVDNVTKEQIRLLEDNAPQTISFFSKDERPVTYGVAIDASGSFRFLLPSS